MINKMMRLISKALCATLALVLVISCFPVYAQAEDDPFIVVSMGDSYSSGEGIEPFYDQDKAERAKVQDTDWLAHRSELSWPGQLKFQEATDTMYWYRVEPGTTSSRDVQWYFVASSGATTSHFHGKQKKEYDREMTGFEADLEGETYLDPQLNIFDTAGIKNKVDYVTMTIGGNDVGFTSIVESAVYHNAHINNGLENKFSTLWNDKIGSIIFKLLKAYTEVEKKAGSQAEIIVAGYPQLFDRNNRGAGINLYEAGIIGDNVSLFNDLIEDIVNTLAGTSSSSTKTEHHTVIENLINTLNNPPAGPIKMHFVDVEGEFLEHGANSVDENGNDDAWINTIDLFAHDEDLDHDALVSKYSVHPNARGAQAYAECVNEKIQAIEDSKKTGTLSGKIVKASDRSTPVTTATVSVTKDSKTVSFQPGSDGSYSRELPVGTHYVKVVADGYIEFNAYANIEQDETTYMETFLMVQGEEGQIGEACGTITNALTGAGIEGITLDVRKDWGNDSVGEVLTTITTDASGRYMVSLPIGNYTLCASKDGFVSTMINIVVQPNMSTNKNASMTPNVSGDNFRVVLTWGENPRDLDSHMVGTLSSGNSFHVYYSYKSQYDGSVEVCNLDHDDTTSYGPETITLNSTTSKPYYYYVYRYAGSGTVASSGAQVKVYQGETLIKTFNVPTNLGSGDYWNVFAIVDGELIIRNTMTTSAETGYASAATFSFRAPRPDAHPVYDDNYPAKEDVSAEVTEPAENTDMTVEPTTEETVPATEPLEAAAETLPDVETRKVYLSLDQFSQDYTWKVVTQDAEYDVAEEADGIYVVELPVDIESIFLQGEFEDTQISSVEIDLTELQDNNCIVALTCEEDAAEFDIQWGIFDPETEEVTFAVVEALAVEEETPAETVAEETASTEETENVDSVVTDDADAVS